MRTPKPLFLTFFWFGIQTVWGALLGISLQARTTELAPNHAVVGYGQLAIVGACTALAVQLIVGPYSDRLRARGSDRRWFLMIGGALGCVGIFGFYSAHSFSGLIGALIVLQIGMNTAIGPYQAIIPDYLPAAQAIGASAWMAAFQSLGNSLGALSAVVLAKRPLRLAVVLGVILLASGLMTVRHMTALLPRPIERARYQIDRPHVDLFVSRAIIWTGFYTVLGYMFFYVHDTLRIASAVQSSGVVVLIFTASGALGAFLAGRAGAFLDRRMIITLGSAAFVGGVGAFIFLREPRLLFVLAGIAGTGWGGFLAADWALGCTILPAGMMATAMGIWNLAVAGPQILAPILATGAVLAAHADTAHSPVLAFEIAVVEAAVGALWVWRIPAKR